MNRQLFLKKKCSRALSGMLFRFVDYVGGLVGDEESGFEVGEDFQTSPCVDGRVCLLGFGQLDGFPVAESLPFADSLSEEDCEDFLKTCVGDRVFFDEVLELDETLRVERADFVEVMEVVFERESDLCDVGVFEELA